MKVPLLLELPSALSQVYKNKSYIYKYVVLQTYILMSVSFEKTCVIMIIHNLVASLLNQSPDPVDDIEYKHLNNKDLCHLSVKGVRFLIQ